MVRAQGGDLDAPRSIAPASELASPQAAFVSAIDAEELGRAIIAMGGGRQQLGDKLDHATGVEMLVRLAFDIDDPLVTLGVQVESPSTAYGYLIPDVDSRAEVGGLDAYRLARFEEKPTPERAEALQREPGVAWNAGIFLWRRRAIRAALQRYTGLLQTIEPMTGSMASLERAYESIQRALSIDVAVMEGAARAGSVVMGSMDVGWSDLGSWSALLQAIGARGEGAVVRSGETVTVDDGDLVVRRVDGRLGVIAPPERGSMTATQPIAVLRGAASDVDRISELIERCAGLGDDR
jgi:mannose-1-phosphate guanylyltransferase